MKNKPRLLPAVVFLCWLCLPAQATQEPGSREEAEEQLISQAESFRRESARKPEKAPAPPEVKVEEKEKKPAPQVSGPGFLLKKVDIEGNTLFSSETLEKYVAGFLNRETDYAGLDRLVQLITNHYRSQGYLTSHAYLPPQRIEDGVVRIRIIEGKVGDISVQENRYFSDETYVEAVHFSQTDAQGRPYLRYQDLAQSLFQINEAPDREVRGYLAATEDPEIFDLVIKTSETPPFHAYYEYNNRGTKLTHRSRHILSAYHNSVSGRGDLLQGSVWLAEEGALGGVAGSYVYPRESTGTTFRLDASHSRSQIVKHLKSAEIEGESLNFSPEISQKFYRSPAALMEAFLAFDWKDSKTSVDDLKTSFDRTRAIRTGPRFTFYDGGGRTVLQSAAHIGLSDFEAPSRPNAGDKFLYYTVQAARLQALPAGLFLILRGSGQWTTDTLPSSEHYRLGGAHTVRGYPESDASGDYGCNLSAELRVPLWRKALQAVGFLDTGKAYIRERVLPGDTKDEFLLGIGFGVRVSLWENTFLQCDIGWPLGDRSSDENQAQIHIAVRGGF